jgi:hypothetical protein
VHRKYKLILFTGALLVILSVLLLWPLPVLAVRIYDTNHVLFSAGVSYGDEFTLQFLHSYEKGWVEETYIIEKGHFNLTRHRYQVYSYDAREFTFPGKFSLKDGYAIVEDIDSYIKTENRQLLIRSAYTVPQNILVNNKVFNLNEKTAGGVLVVIKIESWPFIRKFIQ